jgi:hypothetical protein
VSMKAPSESWLVCCCSRTSRLSCSSTRSLAYQHLVIRQLDVFCNKLKEGKVSETDSHFGS